MVLETPVNEDVGVFTTDILVTVRGREAKCRSRMWRWISQIITLNKLEEE